MDTSPNIKVYVLSINAARQLRIVMVKKSGDLPAQLSLSVVGQYGAGELSLLTGSSLISTDQDMTLAGQQITSMGEMTGDQVVQVVPVGHPAWGSSQYLVDIPAYSAALMVISLEDEA
jgi:hypothetical protein